MGQRIRAATRIDETAVRRIVRTYRKAGEVELEQGATWYAAAAADALEIAADGGIPFRSVAGVIAALSPRTSWELNVRWARELARAYAAGETCPRIGTTANRRKAWEIAAGADPLEVLSGPKVRAFFGNIVGR